MEKEKCKTLAKRQCSRKDQIRLRQYYELLVWHNLPPALVEAAFPSGLLVRTRQSKPKQRKDQQGMLRMSFTYAPM